MKLQIRPPIRLALLSGVFFIVFFSFIASVNNISSLSVTKDSVQVLQNKQRTQKTDHMETITKNLNEELNRNNANETLLRVKPSELQKLDPNSTNLEQAQPANKNTPSKVFLTR